MVAGDGSDPTSWKLFWNVNSQGLFSEEELGYM